MVVSLHLPDSLSAPDVRRWLELGVEAGMAMTIDRLVEKLRSRAA
jgi:hypothetical protein